MAHANESAVRRSVVIEKELSKNLFAALRAARNSTIRQLAKKIPPNSNKKKLSISYKNFCALLKYSRIKNLSRPQKKSLKASKLSVDLDINDIRNLMRASRKLADRIVTAPEPIIISFAEVAAFCAKPLPPALPPQRPLENTDIVYPTAIREEETNIRYTARDILALHCFCGLPEGTPIDHRKMAHIQREMRDGLTLPRFIDPCGDIKETELTISLTPLFKAGLLSRQTSLEDGKTQINVLSDRERALKILAQAKATAAKQIKILNAPAPTPPQE